MTPGINEVKQAGVSFRLHEYHHEAGTESYGLEAARKMGVEKERVYKTLVVSHGRKELAVAVVPVSRQLNLKAFAKAIGTRKVTMADAVEVERSTGYVLGGVCPLGQKKKLVTIMDGSAQEQETIYVSAGRRGLELELSPLDLLQLANATLADIST